MSEKSTALTALTADNFTLDNVPQLLENVNAKIQALKPSNSTTSIMKKEFGAGFGKLKDTTKLSSLVYFYAAVSSREELYNKAADEMKKESAPKFSIAGHTSEEWKKAILERYTQVENAATLKNLEDSKVLLEKHLSKDNQFKNDMTKLLGNLTKPLE